MHREPQHCLALIQFPYKAVYCSFSCSVSASDSFDPRPSYICIPNVAEDASQFNCLSHGCISKGFENFCEFRWRMGLMMASMLMKAGTFLLVPLRLLIKIYRTSATRNTSKPSRAGKWVFLHPRRGMIGQMRPVFADIYGDPACACVRVRLRLIGFRV